MRAVNELGNYFVYILSNTSDSVLYIGCTHDLIQRVVEHQDKLFSSSFSKRYNLNKLVYYEVFADKDSAYSREKKLKDWHRAWKDELINKTNPGRRDLSVDFHLSDLD